MPNICENWAAFSGSAATLAALKAVPFDLPDPPAGLTPEQGLNWTWDNCSTKWICNETRNGLPILRGDEQSGLTVHFDSAWNPPVGFYKLLVGQYPDLVIHYEYHCWESGFIGHGRMDSASIDAEPVHCSYDTPEELSAFIKGRTWIICTGNPHFEIK